MQRLLTNFIDLIFPPTANEKLLRTIKPDTYQQLRNGGIHKNIEYIGHYSEPLLRTAVIENKFNHHLVATNILGLLLKVWLAKKSGITLFIPIPLGPTRKRDRGHNQVESILQAAGITHINTTLLKRTTETRPQAQLQKTERLANMKGAFTFTDSEFDFTPYTQVVLFDDVVTTGATLLAARAELLAHIPPHIKLHCLAIAH
ncbi:MAG: hypothetical protein RLZZ230_744 [Candidatus Parcubacteria bacterium]|jgi:predicted amidophosphoribosyltransferase